MPTESGSLGDVKFVLSLLHVFMPTRIDITSSTTCLYASAAPTGFSIMRLCRSDQLKGIMPSSPLFSVKPLDMATCEAFEILLGKLSLFELDTANRIAFG